MFVGRRGCLNSFCGQSVCSLGRFFGSGKNQDVWGCCPCALPPSPLFALLFFVLLLMWLRFMCASRTACCCASLPPFRTLPVNASSPRLTASAEDLISAVSGPLQDGGDVMVDDWLVIMLGNAQMPLLPEEVIEPPVLDARSQVLTQDLVKEIFCRFSVCARAIVEVPAPFLTDTALINCRITVGRRPPRVGGELAS